MKRTKKVLCLTIAVLLCLGAVLTGCGEKAQPKGSDAAPSVENSSEVKEELKQVELTWYYRTNAQPEQDKVFEEANKITKEKLNASVRFTPIDSGSYEEKMKIKTAAAEIFDICWTSSWNFKYADNVAKSAFQPIDDLLAQYGQNIKKTIPEKFWDAARVNGKLYGIINYQILVKTQGVWIRKDLADKYNFDPKSVKTHKDLEPFLELVKSNDPQITPLELRNMDGFYYKILPIFGYEQISSSAGVKFADSSPKVVNLYTLPEFKEYLTLVRDWYQKGYIRADAATINDSSPDLKAGKYACGFEGNAKPGADAERKAKYGYDVYVQPITESIADTGSILSTLSAISSTSKNPERAMMLLDLVNSDVELYNLLTHGIDGVHYTKVSENRIEIPKDSKYNPGNTWVIGNVFNSYLIPGQTDTVWEDTIKQNESARPSSVLGFVFNPEPVVSEVTQITSVIKEFEGPLLTGSVDPDEVLPKFLDKLEKAGNAKFLEEMQRQIDEWMKTR